MLGIFFSDFLNESVIRDEKKLETFKKMITD